MRFQEILDGVEKTRQEVLSEIKRKKDEKKKILEEQLNIIHSEKNKVDADVKVKNRFCMESNKNSHYLAYGIFVYAVQHASYSFHFRQHKIK